MAGADAGINRPTVRARALLFFISAVQGEQIQRRQENVRKELGVDEAGGCEANVTGTGDAGISEIVVQNETSPRAPEEMPRQLCL